MSGIVCIILYLLCFVGCYYYCKRKCYYVYNYKKQTINTRKISIVAILLISVLFCMLNVYATNVATTVGGDRINYTYEFMSGRKTSIGLDALFNIFKNLGLNVNSVFYFSTFVTCIMIFMAYKLLQSAGYLTVYFLLCTNIIFFSFTGIKQTYTVGFATLFFALVLREKNRKNEIAIVILMILACLFHSTGFILLPIYFMRFFIEKFKSKLWLFIFIILICVIFFQPLCLKVASLVVGIFPALSQKIYIYFGENSSSDNSMTFLRGIPFYLLWGYGCLFRKNLRCRIKKYDSYFLLTTVGVVFYLLAFKSYWMYRFTYIFYFPMAIFFDELVSYSTGANKQIIKYSVGVGTLFVTLREVFMVFWIYGGF